MNTESITLKVEGMSCGGCENAVKNILEGTAGVASAKASHVTSTAEIVYSPNQVSVDQLIAKINEGAYKASLPDSSS